MKEQRDLELFSPAQVKISTDTHEMKFLLYKAEESTKDMAVSPRLLSWNS